MSKFLGICILISSIIISCGLIINGLSNRYYSELVGSEYTVFDKLTGNYYVLNEKGVLEINIIYGTHKKRELAK